MRNPIQPLAKDEHGVMRFKPNEIVQHLLDTHSSVDLNSIGRMEFSDDDREQFAQLIGYSLRGYSELSYVSNESYAEACHMANSDDESNARIAALEEELAELRGAVCEMHEPLAKLLGVSPDDFKE